MCPPPDERPETAEVTTPPTTDEVKPVESAEAPKEVEATAQVEAPAGAETPKEPSCCCGDGVTLWGFRPPVLMYTGFSLMVIVFALWILFTWTGYSDKYSQTTEGWSLGSTKMIEITLIRDDRENLSCASDLVFDGHRCGFGANRKPEAGIDEAHLLSPYNTIKNELFVASNLWTSLNLKELPKERFSVVCNYHVLGVAKHMGLRWQKKGGFDNLKHSVAVGTLSNCVIPR